MPLTPDEVAHVALLARLGLSEDERARIGSQLGAILEAIQALQQVDVEGVPETAQVTGLVNVWREDEVRLPLGAAAALANAPETDGEHFVVGAIQE